MNFGQSCKMHATEYSLCVGSRFSVTCRSVVQRSIMLHFDRLMPGNVHILFFCSFVQSSVVNNLHSIQLIQWDYIIMNLYEYQSY